MEKAQQVMEISLYMENKISKREEIKMGKG